MFASAVQEDTFIYDTNTAVSNENPIRNPRENQDAPSQGGIEAHLRTEIDYDRAGNAVSVKRLGRLDGNHHPTGLGHKNRLAPAFRAVPG